MDVSEDRIVLWFGTEGPVDLERLVESFGGLANQYRRVLQAHGLKPGETDARLFVTRINSGSVEAEIATAAVALGHVMQTMDYGLIFIDLTSRVKRTLDFFTNKEATRLLLNKQDCDEFKVFIGAVSDQPNGSLKYSHARFRKVSSDEAQHHQIVAEFKLDKRELDRAEINISKEIERLKALEAPRSHMYKDMLLYWHQTNVEKGKTEGRTADKAIIKDISGKPLRVYFPPGSETLKHTMTAAEHNSFKKGFIVNVHVQYHGDSPVLYVIQDVLEVIDLEDSEDDDAQGRLT